jgi:hypothetical protein
VTYVTGEPIKSWHGEYLKSFRDALAHRISLYQRPLYDIKTAIFSSAALNKTSNQKCL